MFKKYKIGCILCLFLFMHLCMGVSEVRAENQQYGRKKNHSEVVSKTSPKSASVTRKTLSLSKKFYMGSQYSWNWASSDTAYYYVASGKLGMVVPDKNCLRIYTLNRSLRKRKSKKIKIKYDYFGGFYHAKDGNFYIALGYDNPKEKDKKTVIKVIKYSKNWKKGKTCNIKGSAANQFKGIYRPFSAGNCRMDMQGTTLYMHTCREMYAVDNVHHQSNISFAIDTKTMKGSTTGDSYVSHSFNQFVKFDNGNLYLLDHGDAYPRSIVMTMVKDDNAAGKTSVSANLFSLKGNIGDNFTGCTVGGMEVSKNHVLVCGTSQPHHYKIKGISGRKGNYAPNVYLIVADKENGKSKVKWLTKYNPKKTKVQVGETRMVKLDDNRFAVMYTTTQGKKRKLHYLVVDGNGKKIKKKTYSHMLFGGGTQPVLYKGRVVWADYDEEAGKNKIYAIPALLK